MKVFGTGVSAAGLFLAALLGLAACGAGTTAAAQSGTVADGQTSTELNAKEVAKRVNRPVKVILAGKTGTCTAEPGSTLKHNNYDDLPAQNGRPAYVGVFYQAPDNTYKAPVGQPTKPVKNPKAGLCSNFHGHDLSGHTGHVEAKIFQALPDDVTAA
jgi:hypothetical protein